MPDTMTTEMMLRFIGEYGPHTAAQVVSGDAIFRQMTEGWDMTSWAAQTRPGAILFFRVTADKIVTGETRILAVNAPEADRQKWEAISVQSDAPTVLILSPSTVSYKPLPMVQKDIAEALEYIANGSRRS